MRSDEPGTKTIVYVSLLDEGVDVWRPVEAEVMGDGLYRIIGEKPDDEQWEYEPGTLVRCCEKRFEGGTLGLVASESVR